MDNVEVKGALEAMLFASGEPLPIRRLAQVLGTEEDEVTNAALDLAGEYERENRGIRLVRIQDSLQLHSAPQYAELITAVLEQRRPPRLSPTSLEVLAIVAYYQPVTRAYVEQMRGADSAYTMGVLAERGMIEPCGHLETVGRPTLYRTTGLFLRTMGISSLDQLPPLPNLAESDAARELQEKVEQLKALQEAENGSDLRSGTGEKLAPQEKTEENPAE